MVPVDDQATGIALKDRVDSGRLGFRSPQSEQVFEDGKVRSATTSVAAIPGALVGELTSEFGEGSIENCPVETGLCCSAFASCSSRSCSLPPGPRPQWCRGSSPDRWSACASRHAGHWRCDGDNERGGLWCCPRVWSRLASRQLSLQACHLALITVERFGVGNERCFLVHSCDHAQDG